MLQKLIIPVLSCFLLLVGQPEQVRGQEDDCLSCTDYYSSAYQQVIHTFEDTGDGEHPAVCEPNDCHDDAKAKYCYEYHYDCDGGGGSPHEDPDEEDLALIQAIAEEGVRPPLNRIRRLTALYPERLFLNRDRRALQLKNCRGEVIAHVPMDESEVAGD